MLGCTLPHSNLRQLALSDAQLCRKFVLAQARPNAEHF